MAKSDSGREPKQICEIHQEKCANTCGVAPCTAALGVTGSEKCFNTFKTCQDPDNYDGSDVQILRFVKPQANAPGDEYLIPSLRSVSTAPTKINIGGGSRDSSPLGNRATVTVNFEDHPHTDRVVDPYVDERNYDPFERGTFWSKWLARNPFYQNTTMVIREGYIEEDIDSMVSRQYIIDRITGPNASGRVTIKAQDILKLADNDKAQAPAPSTGELASDINQAIADIDVITEDPSEYPSSGTVRISDELIEYTSKSTITGGVKLSGATRGSDGSEAESHDEGDRVQLCLRYTDQVPHDIAYDLLTTYGNVPASFIDKTAWDAEGDVWISEFIMSTVISQPTGVTDLLGEITEQALFYIWWDEKDQLIKLRAIRPEFDNVSQFNDENHIIAGSFELTEDPKQRVSQVWVYYLQRDASQDIEEEANYKKLRIRADLDAESDNEYGETRIRKVFARWLTTDAQAIATSVRILRRYRDNPRFIRFRLDAKDRDFWTGNVADVTTRQLVDFTGQEQTIRFQAISAEEILPGEVVQYDLQTTDIFGNFGYWMEDSAPIYSDATDADKEQGAWWADSNGELPDGTDGYVWV